MFIWLIFAYLIGSLPFGKILCLIGGVDIQKRGSGNIGYANVERIMGWRFSVPTLILDIAKGAVPTYFAYSVMGPQIAFFVGVAAIIGHIFPVWLRFRGGKGVATGLGVLLIFAPIPAIVGMVVYFSFLGMSHQSSFASLVGAFIAIAGFVALHPHFWWMGCILLTIAVLTLRQNFFGKVPDYG